MEKLPGIEGVGSGETSLLQVRILLVPQAQLDLGFHVRRSMIKSTHPGDKIMLSNGKKA